MVAFAKTVWPTALLLAATALTAVAPAFAQQQVKPNILFILADNTGYGDIGAYGGGELRGAPTPRLDQLVTEGLRLTQFLVEPACTPSRAALMTGRYSIRSRPVAGCGRRHDLLAPGEGSDHRRDARRRWLRHRDLRQVASWCAALALTNFTAFRQPIRGMPSG
jgi:Sulfatase